MEGKLWAQFTQFVRWRHWLSDDCDHYFTDYLFSEVLLLGRRIYGCKQFRHFLFYQWFDEFFSKKFWRKAKSFFCFFFFNNCLDNRHNSWTFRLLYRLGLYSICSRILHYNQFISRRTLSCTSIRCNFIHIHLKPWNFSHSSQLFSRSSETDSERF